MSAQQQTPSLEGGCMCGACRFTLSAPPRGATYCHCTRCRRRTGTAWSINARLEPGSLTWSAGEELIRWWDPGDGGWRKGSCSVCGSQLASADPREPQQTGIRFGAFDGDPGVRPSAHLYTRYAASWAEIPDDGLPRWPEGAGEEAAEQ